jgi:hypothetical protein
VLKETGIDIVGTCFFMLQRLSGTRKRVTWSASGGWQSNWRESICTAAVLNVAKTPWPTRRQLLDSIPCASPNRALPGGRVDTPTSFPLASPHGSVAPGPWGIRSKCASASTPSCAIATRSWDRSITDASLAAQNHCAGTPLDHSVGAARYPTTARRHDGFSSFFAAHPATSRSSVSSATSFFSRPFSSCVASTDELGRSPVR